MRGALLFFTLCGMVSFAIVLALILVSLGMIILHVGAFVQGDFYPMVTTFCVFGILSLKITELILQSIKQGSSNN